MADAAKVTLPAAISSPGDIRRLRREVEAVDEFLRQASLRQGGKAVKLPATSQSLDEMVGNYDLNLLKAGDRERLTKYFNMLLAEAPMLHFSFASEPSPAFMLKLIGWLRTNIHPQVLVRIGLQPSIAAGCIVRTANHEYDLSLKQYFEEKRPLLMDMLKTEVR